jgi:hypothetical protein
MAQARWSAEMLASPIEFRRTLTDSIDFSGAKSDTTARIGSAAAGTAATTGGKSDTDGSTESRPTKVRLGRGKGRSPYAIDCGSAAGDWPTEETGLLAGVASVMDLDAFGEEAFTTALAASREGGASGFSAHAGTEPVLVLAGAFGALKGAFHIGISAAGVSGLERVD